MIETPQRAAEGRDGRGQPPLGRTGALPGSADPVQARVKRQLWMAACVLALAVLAFVDRPGKIIADTKLDLALNPIGFLERALHLWDPAQLGQLQNQPSGYFFPMGPFFALGKLMALPPWVVQRLWLTAVLIIAFTGLVRLTAELRVGTPLTQLVAGLGYALAPRELSELGAISIELLPAALAPWILLPLVQVVGTTNEHRSGGIVRASVRSAAAVACCGGVNAVSVLAALLPPVIYLCAAPRPARRWRILACWVPLVGIATWFWLPPLLLLGKYGVSFLPYTESASTTTSVTSLSNTLRGTEDWVSYLVVNGRPWWPVGFWIATSTLATVLTGLIAGLGLAGLLRVRMTVRRPLLCILLAGILIVTTGYLSGLGSPVAAPLDHLINGPLAPLRNFRKFDLLIRLPVAIGIAGLLASLRRPVGQTIARAVALAAIVVLAVPAYVTGLSPLGDFASVPRYWQDAARWLNKHAAHQGVLAVPGASFGEYIWGRPMDDVLQPYLTDGWVSLQLSTIGSPGLERLLEAIDLRLANGDGSPGLGQLLARMGIRYVVARNDLFRPGLRGAWPARINQALSQSAGIEKVAAFGPVPVGTFYPDNAVSSFDTPYQPVEIYRVQDVQPLASVFPADQAIRIYGGPEALLTLADERLLRGRPVLLNSDSPATAAPRTVVTDSLRRRVRNFGEIRVDYSPTLTAADPAHTFEAATDFLEPAWAKFASVAKYYGISDISASSSDASITAIPAQSATGRLPFAAVDGNLRTMWESGALTGPVGQWIKLTLTQPINLSTIRVTFADSRVIGPPVTSVAIRTAAGTVTDRVRVTGHPQNLRVPAGQSTWLRLTVTKTKWKAKPAIGRQVGIADITVPGLAPTRTIMAPVVRLRGGGDPTAVLLAKAEPRPSGCMLTSLRWVCNPGLATSTEEQFGFDQSFSVAEGRPVSLRGSAALVDRRLIAQYAWIGRRQPIVTGTSAFTADAQDQPQSAFDGNRLTTWIAGRKDSTPALTIRFAGPRTLRELKITRPPGAAAPTPVLMTGSHGEVRGGYLSSSASTLKFAPMRTNSLRLSFTPAVLPLQITEVSIPGVRPLSSGGSSPFTLPCGYGPQIQLNGKSVPTSVSGTFTDVHNGSLLEFAACGVTRINAGSNRVTEPSSDSFDVQDVVLELHHGPLLDGGQAIQPGRPEVLSWTSSRRIVRLATDQASYLAVNENFNPGWIAVVGARTLRPIRLDGWKQGWVLPAGTRGIVTLTYAPDSTYRPNLLIGLGAVSLILAAAVAPVGRLRRRGQLVPVGTEPELVAPLEIPDPLLSRWSASRMLVLLIAGLALLLAVGLWLGGNSGAIVMPVAGAAFFAAVAFSGRSAICRMASSPWVVTCLLIAAAIMNAIGVQLRHGGHVTVTSAVLAGAGPQLLCLVIVARLIVALLVTATEGGATPGNDPPVPRASLPQAPPAVRALSRDRLCLPPRPGQPDR